MPEILYDEIPSLDLADFKSLDPKRKKYFVDELAKAFKNFGFVAVKNHGFTEEQSTKLYRVVKDFFSLPVDIKMKYDLEGFAGQRGYTGKGKEHAKGRSVGDLKEFYHVGQEVEDEDPIKEQYPDNVWPAELPEFKTYSLKAYKTLENAGKEILRAIALFLRLNADFFDQKVQNGNSILRPIHYFPINNPDEVPEDAVRAAEHGDINLITLLMGASAEGLQVLRKDSKWIPIEALPDQIIVNVGDMMERLTNNILKSTLHRVVNPTKEKMGESRYSIPFFMHPRSEMDLNCLENCIDSNHPKQFADISAGDFLEERLREIGLRK